MTLCLIFFPKNNNLLPSNKSGFRPGDSYINQFLSINHEILSAFDMGLEVRGIFLDISKAFDKIWHDGLIFKLPQNRIYGEIINILEEFLSDRKQSSKNHLQSAFSNVKKDHWSFEKTSTYYSKKNSSDNL